jgi:hypothetical protein
MGRGNNVIPNNHFHKDWQHYVECHFDQATQAKSRRLKRARKAASVAPRPVELLRPVVRCPTFKHNTKVRLGRGFTIAEFKVSLCGVPRVVAIIHVVPVLRSNDSIRNVHVHSRPYFLVPYYGTVTLALLSLICAQ